MFKEPAAQAASALTKGKPQTSKPTTSKSGAAPAPKTVEPFVPLSENPGLSMDNPFIEIIMDEQYEEIFESDLRAETGVAQSDLAMIELRPKPAVNELREQIDQALEILPDRATTNKIIAERVPADPVCEQAKVHSSFLDKINPIPSANAAVPLVLCAEEAVMLAAPLVISALMPNRDDDKLEFPIHQEENDGVYPGEPADPSLTGPTILTTPIGEQQGLTKLETLVDQPKPDSSSLGFPIHKHPVPFLYNYVKNSFNSTSNEVGLFRAIKLSEYEQIKRTHNFQGIGNGIKYFTRSLEEAKRYASKEPGEKYVIVSTLYKGKIKGNSQAPVDGGIRAVILQDHELGKLSPPVIVDQGYLFKDISSQANGNVMKLPGTYSGLSYNHSIQDHSNRMNSFGDSIIRDQQTGQRLLDTGYINPAKPDQVFNYHQWNVINFKLMQDGIWQASIIEKDTKRLVGTNVLRPFNKDNLISNAEYKALLKL